PDSKFKGSVLDQYVPSDLQQPSQSPFNDHVVSGPTPDNLAEYLPYAQDSTKEELDDI
ncbi:hypothetical protein WICPIJ_003934, partial [Wickerhamomyces pijperi]